MSISPLSAYEKKSLLRFLLIYLLSIYTFILVLAYQFYTIEIKNTYETYNFKIRAFSSSVSNQIITEHMMHHTNIMECLNTKQVNECFANSESYHIALFDENNTALFLGFEESVDFTQKFYVKNESLFYIDDSPQLHLGVKYLVVKQTNIMQTIHAIQKNILYYTLLSFALATLLGYVLAKLFLKPIRDEIATLDTFIKDSTHELNTPITAILMSIETLKEIDPKKKKRIEQSGKRIASLYANLSYMLLHDKQNEEKSTVDIKKLIEARIDYFYDVMNSKRIRLTLLLEEKSLHVNEESMVKLIDNLLSNAIKYNALEGSINVELTQAFLAISDTGIGIEESKLSTITQRYKRANSDKGGFGIGLDIVNTICKANRFKLEITSKLARGSCFKVYF